MKFTTGLTIILSLLLLCTIPTPVFAQSAGSSCNTANKVIYPTYTTGTDTAYVCDGAHLVTLETVTGSPLQVGIGGAVSGTNLFSVNGSSYFSGNVGIGTTSPGYALDLIHSPGSSTFRLGADTTNYMYMDSGGVESHIYSFAARPFKLGANGNPAQLVLDSTGNVGIGTIAPLTTLYANGAIGTNNSLRLYDPGSNSTYETLSYSNSYPVFDITGAGGGVYKFSRNGIDGVLITVAGAVNVPTSSNGGVSAGIFRNSGGGVFGSDTSFVTDTGIFANTSGRQVGLVANGTTGLLLNNNGRVGIGITAPLSGLDVQNPITAASGLAYGGRYQQTLTAAANADSLTALYINPTFTDGGFTGVTHNGLIVARGNVGIGTTTPNSPLTVKALASNANSFQILNTTGGITFRLYDFPSANEGGLASVFDGIGNEKVRLFAEGSSYFTGGNVGIGTTAPNAKLTISGGGISTGSASNTDLAGRLTLVAGTKSYSFAGTYTGTPVCVASDSAAPPIAAQVTTTASTLTLTVPGGANTDTFDYICIVQN